MKTSLFRRLFFLHAFLLFSAAMPMHAQEDSTVTGVVRVRCDSVRASYAIGLRYDYVRNAGKGAWWLEPQYMAFEPVPVVGFAAAATKKDTSRIIKELREMPRPKQAFDWKAFTDSSLFFQFACTDTIRLDSACIMIDVWTDGLALLTVVKPAGDSLTPFEQQAVHALLQLWLWHPACLQEKEKRPMLIPSTVIVTIYAYDKSSYKPRRPNEK
jgi:hypothetical protein